MSDCEGPLNSPMRLSGIRPSFIIIDLGIGGRIHPNEIPRLLGRLQNVFDRWDAQRVVCDLSRLTVPDVTAVDALARLRLLARRNGKMMSVTTPCRELQELVDFVGLSVLGLSDPLPLQACRQAKEREEAGGVEEEADPDDPVS